MEREREFAEGSGRTREYLDAVAMLRKLKPDHARRAFAEAVWDRERDAWATAHGLKRSRDACIGRLFGRRCLGSVSCCFPPALADHCTLWLKNGKPHVFVSQPYPGSAEDMRKALDFAELNGLTLVIGTWPSWHFPGAVLTMEYYRKIEGPRAPTGPPPDDLA